MNTGWLVITLILFILLIVGCCRCCSENFGNTDFEQLNLPDDSLFVIYSAGNSGYQEWQSDLLDFSFKQSKQPGTLIRIVSDDSPKDKRRKINKTTVPGGHTLITPDFSKINDTKNWPVMNKPGSMKFFMDSLSPDFKKRNKDAVLVFLDPDMIFTKPWDPRNKFKQGEVYGQTWKGYSNQYCTETSINPELCPKSETSGPIMFPFAIHLGDFNKIYNNINDFAKKGYLKKGSWEGDMPAFVTAIEKAGYKNIQINNLGLCNNWNNTDDPDAPIIHFCQAAKDKGGKEIWGKRRYQRSYMLGDTFDSVPDPSLATNRVDREVLTMITKFRNEQLSNL